MNLKTRNHSFAPSLRRLLFRDLTTRPTLLSMSLFAGLVLFGLPLFGQGNSGNAANRIPLSEDWTDQQVVFSKPANPQKSVDVSKDPRFLKQFYKRNLAGSRNPNVTNPAAGTTSSGGTGGNGGNKKNPPPV